MKDEIARLKQELLLMEKTLSTGKVPYEIYERQSGINEEKIRGIEEELEKLGQDTSNLVLYLDKVLQNLENLPGMWEKLDLIGKVRLQKLVYPTGMQYVAENHVLRTTVINPIFFAITSISQNLNANNAEEKYPEEEKLSQVYLGFSSSNFFWENLEKTVMIMEEFQAYVVIQPKPAVSMSGATPTSMYFYASDSTEIPGSNYKISALNALSCVSYSGSTIQPFFRQ